MGHEIRFILNDELVATDDPAGSVVLDFVRRRRHLVGTKIGCREGDCGACTVLVGRLAQGRVAYDSMTSCLMPLGNAHGKHLLTIEGLNLDHLSPVQQAIADEGGTQCGFCTVGFVVSLVGFCLANPAPTIEGAIAAIDGNICRCTGYKPIERAAITVAQRMAAADRSDRVGWLISNGFLPAYFSGIAERLACLQASLGPPGGSSDRSGTPIGGGTDIFVQRPGAMVEVEVDLLLDRTELQGIHERDGRIVIGASTTAQEIRDSPLLRRYIPRLLEHMKLVASTPIRNMATVAGNLVNASPIGDLTIIFLALGARAHLAAGDARRAVALHALYRGYKQLDLASGERLEAVSFTAPAGRTHFNFEKVSKRTHLDIASVNTAARIEADHGVIIAASLSAGGVAPIPLLLRETSTALVGQTISSETARRAAASAVGETSPISDVRGSADYKRLLLRQLVFAHFLTLFPAEIRLESLG